MLIAVRGEGVGIWKQQIEAIVLTRCSIEAGLIILKGEQRQ